jgi:pre-mRNA-splicing factor ATP-dependent RNA helicase DHX38/PRP16
MWETSRMLSSGIVQRREVDTDFDEEDQASSPPFFSDHCDGHVLNPVSSQNRVHLLVHDIKPPFLDGRIVYTKQLEPVQHVRDPTSDMAVFSRKGSALVREKREQAERAKAHAGKFDLAGTNLGNILGIKAKPEGGKLNKKCKGKILR